MEFHNLISELIEEKRKKTIALSDKVWEYAEIAFEERQSAQYIMQALASEGFVLKQGVAGLQTGFVASYGRGKPVVAILGEFDALTGLSQKNGLVRHEPLAASDHGHGCGHNLLGAGAFAAVVAVKDYMTQTGLAGTIRYYGCPAEESGSGKAFMARAGLFDDVDLALSWHPSATPSIMNVTSLANYAATFKFDGRSAHAAAAPHLGRSALDAVELMNVGVNYLREHMVSEARVHYAITDAGGKSPNVVQPHAEVIYLIRAPQKKQVQDLYARVLNIAKGAALMTETTVEVAFEGTALNLIPNTTLAEKMQEHFSAMGVPEYDEQDQLFAKEIRMTLSQDALDAACAGLDKKTAKALTGKELADVIPPLGAVSMLSGSTDVGDVSWVAPTMQCMIPCWAMGTPFHTWQAVTQSAMPIAHKGMLQAGKIIAATAIDAMQNPNIIKKAKEEWLERLDGETYESLLPEGAMPPRKAGLV